ncbi:MAG: substrate-binding domain-containing protein, partial [Pseudomonadota bacterium]|nr:substrate-binding domain-containing protein [Pseudomonadota bacterium]
TVLPTSNDPADVKAKVKAAIASDPEIDTIVTLTASLAGEPAVEAIAEAGAEGKINLGSFDLSAGLLQAVADGKAAFAIDQQQYLQGYMPVVILALYDKYGLVPSADLPSGPNLITQEKAAQVVELSAQGIR